MIKYEQLQGLNRRFYPGTFKGDDKFKMWCGEKEARRLKHLAALALTLRKWHRESEEWRPSSCALCDYLQALKSNCSDCILTKLTGRNENKRMSKICEKLCNMHWARITPSHQRIAKRLYSLIEKQYVKEYKACMKDGLIFPFVEPRRKICRKQKNK